MAIEIGDKVKVYHRYAEVIKLADESGRFMVRFKDGQERFVLPFDIKIDSKKTAISQEQKPKKRRKKKS